MRAHVLLFPVLGLAVAGLALTGSLSAQSAAHTHMGHVLDAFNNTPEGRGLLPTALAEAEVAATHAGLALRDLTNLDAMKRHTGHVLNAIDPTEMAQGPGLGYGVKRGAEGIVRHIEMAGSDESASENVQTHAGHVAASAGNTVQRTAEIVSLGKRIMEAGSAEAASPLLEQLAELTRELTTGVDANGDGRVGWQEGEGGLAQAEQHMNLMKRGEGMGG